MISTLQYGLLFSFLGQEHLYLLLPRERTEEKYIEKPPFDGFLLYTLSNDDQSRYTGNLIVCFVCDPMCQIIRHSGSQLHTALVTVRTFSPDRKTL